MTGSPAFATFDTYWGQAAGAGHLRDAKMTAAALTSFDAAIEALKNDSVRIYAAV